MNAISYWDMTYAEIRVAIQAYVKQQEVNMRTQAVIAFHQANQISLLVSRLVGNKANPPEVHEAYPGLFPEAERRAEQEKLQQQHWQIMKDRISEYASNEAEKRKRGERLGNNAGRTSGPNNS